jgi:hypothetical protein
VCVREREGYLLRFGRRGKVEAVELAGGVHPLAERVRGLLEGQPLRHHTVHTHLCVCEREGCQRAHVQHSMVRRKCTDRHCGTATRPRSN